MKHFCTNLPNFLKEDSCTDVEIYKEKKRWYYCYKRYANDQDVKMGEASSVGDLDISVEFIIYYCPYCGKKLA